MVTLTVPDELAQKLNEIARRENRPVTEVLATMVAQYAWERAEQSGDKDPLEAIIGIYDDPITDLSTTVRETLSQSSDEIHENLTPNPLSNGLERESRAKRDGGEDVENLRTRA